MHYNIKVSALTTTNAPFLLDKLKILIENARQEIKFQRLAFYPNVVTKCSHQKFYL